MAIGQTNYKHERQSEMKEYKSNHIRHDTVRLDQRTLFKASWKETRGVESATKQVITTHVLGREKHSEERVKI